MSDEQNAKSVNIDPRRCVIGEAGSTGTELTQYPDSIQDGLRMYLHPIKNEDPQLDFYTMYKREAMEYDTEHMQKYNEDLNTTLIFVRFRSLPVSQITNQKLRLVCSPRSVLPSSSTSSQSSSPIPPNAPKHISEQFSSASTDLSLRTKTLQLPRHGMVLPPRLSQHQTFCMPVS